MPSKGNESWVAKGIFRRALELLGLLIDTKDSEGQEVPRLAFDEAVEDIEEENVHWNGNDKAFVPPVEKS